MILKNLKLTDLLPKKYRDKLNKMDDDDDIDVDVKK